MANRDASTQLAPSMMDRVMVAFAQLESGGDIVVAVLAAVLVSLVLVCYARVQQRKHFPPGPWPLPIIGNFLALAGGDLPHRALHKLAAKYGGLVYLRLGSKPCIVVSTVAMANELYKTNDANFASRPKQFGWTVWNNNDENYKVLSLCAYGPFWRQLRRFYYTEVFSPGRHASHQGTRAEEIQYMMRILVEDSKKGDAVNLRTWLYGVTSNIMTRMITNKRYYGTSGLKIETERKDFEDMISFNLQLLSAVVISDYVPYFSFITKLQGHAAKFAKVRDFSNRLSEKIFDLEGHRQRSKDREHDANSVPDFVDVLLEKPLDDGKHLPDKEILKILQEMLNAGTETSAVTVEWAMAELMARPDVVKQAQNELDSVVGAKRLVEESDLPHLPFLQAIVKETFRMHPPVPLLVPHESDQPVEFQGYRFPAGTMLFVNAFTIQRDSSVYKNPDEFDPDRFLAHPQVNHLSANDYYELIPFGAGRRMCPGWNLGNTVSSLMLANLLYIFDWSLPEGQTSVDMSERSTVTVGLKIALRLVAKPRIDLD